MMRTAFLVATTLLVACSSSASSTDAGSTEDATHDAELGAQRGERGAGVIVPLLFSRGRCTDRYRACSHGGRKMARCRRSSRR
jgi:hypothetical protein